MPKHDIFFPCKKCKKKDFKSMRALLEHDTKIHKKSPIDFLNKQTRTSKIFLHILQNPGITNSKIKRVFGYDCDGCIFLLRKRNFIMVENETVNGREINKNYPNVKLILDFFKLEPYLQQERAENIEKFCRIILDHSRVLVKTKKQVVISTIFNKNIFTNLKIKETTSLQQVKDLLKYLYGAMFVSTPAYFPNLGELERLNGIMNGLGIKNFKNIILEQYFDYDLVRYVELVSERNRVLIKIFDYLKNLIERKEYSKAYETQNIIEANDFALGFTNRWPPEEVLEVLRQTYPRWKKMEANEIIEEVESGKLKKEIDKAFED